MSKLYDIHIDLLNGIKSINPDNLPKQYFKYYNVWDNQIEKMISSKGYSFNTPAVFFEIIFEDVNVIGQGYSKNNIKIYFHIVNSVLNTNPVESNAMERNLQIITPRDLIKNKFNLNKNLSCNTLMVCGEKLDYKHDNLYHYIIEFKSSFIDSVGSEIDSGDTIKGFLINPTLDLDIFFYWVSGKTYVSDLSDLVFYAQSGTGNLYLSNGGLFYINSNSTLKSYLFANVVSYNNDIYICKITNSDTEFNLDNWIMVSLWENKSYSAGDFVAFQSDCYLCIIGKSTSVDFIESEWLKIIH